jgi:hypothetical protein
MFKSLLSLITILILSAQNPSPVTTVNVVTQEYANIVNWNHIPETNRWYYDVFRTEFASESNNLADSSSAVFVDRIFANEPLLIYSDSDVKSNVRYHYFVQAVDSNSNKSLYTNYGKRVLGQGKFSHEVDTLAFEYGVSDQELADINGDGYLDLIISGDVFENGQEELHTYLNDGFGTFTLEKNYTTALGQTYDNVSLATYDYDGDGDIDLILSGDLNGIEKAGSYNTYFYENDGSGDFSLEYTLGTGVDRGTVKVADFNNDGHMDVLLVGNIGDEGSDRTDLYLNNGDMSFAAPSNFGNFSGSASRPDVEIADMDEDGNLDIVLYDNVTDDNIVFILRKDTGTHVLRNVDHGINFVYGYDFDLGDIDDDGDFDFVGGYDGDGFALRIYENNGSLSFSSVNSFGLDNWTSYDVAFIDYDNDGDLDIVTTMDNSGVGKTQPVETTSEEFRTVFWENTGEGFSQDTDELHVGYSNSIITVADLDGDFDSDLFISGEIYSGPSKMGANGYFEAILINKSAPLNTRPGFPTNVSAQNIGGYHELSWTKGSDNETGYFGLQSNLYLKDETGAIIAGNSTTSGSRMITARGNAGVNETYTFKDSLPDGNYTLGVQTVDQSGAASSFTEYIYKVDVTPPAPPTNVQASSSLYQVDLTWDASVSSDVEYYAIFVNNDSTRDGSYGVTDVDASTFMASDEQAIANFDLYYFVVAYDSAGNEASSEGLKVNFDGHFTYTEDVLDSTYEYPWMDFGDMDNDGDMDLVFVGPNLDNSYTQVLNVYLNDGNGNLTFNQTIRELNMGNIHLIDMDNDGDIDIIYGGDLSGEGPGKAATDRNVLIYENQFPSFIEHDIGNIGFTHGEVHAADFNNDGMKDFVVGGWDENPFTDSNTRIYLNSGNYSYSLYDSIPGMNSFKIISGHINDDDKLDFVVLDVFSPEIWLVFQNDTGFVSQNSSTHGIYITDSELFDAGDVDNDGDLDLLVHVSSEGSYIATYINDGYGNYSENDYLQDSYTYTVNGGFVDYDNDGDLDIVITDNAEGGEGEFKTQSPYINPGFTDSRTMIYVNSPEGFVELEQEFLPGYSYTDLEFVDIDNDDDMDIFLFAETSSNNNFGLEIPLDKNSLLGKKRHERIQMLKQNGKKGTDGYVDALLINNTNTKNTAPLAPDEISVSTYEKDVTRFYWTEGSDNETPASGLNYNVQITNTADGSIIKSSQSATNGFHKVISEGNAGYYNEREYTLKDSLPDGYYDISVQTLDHNNAASSFFTQRIRVDRTPPDAPTNLVVNASQYQVQLDWTASPSTDVERYEIHISQYDEFESREFIGEVDGSTTTYVDDLAYANIDLFYWVIAVDSNYNESDELESDTVKYDGQFEVTLDELGTSYWNGKHKWADIDADGDMDIIMSGGDNSQFRYLLHIFKNDGNGNFTLHQEILNDMWYQSIAVGDMDNDGDIDVVLTGEFQNEGEGGEEEAKTSSYENLQLHIYENDGSGNFTMTNLGAEGAYAAGLAVSDLDFDGLMDIVISGYDNEDYNTRIFKNLGSFNFVMVDSISEVSGNQVYVADIDNNGLKDIVILNPEGGIEILANDEEGWEILDDDILNINMDGYSSLDIGDVNNDGLFDLLGYYSNEGGGLAVYINEGDFEFSSDVFHEAYYDVFGRFADFNNDGKLDVVVTGIGVEFEDKMKNSAKSEGEEEDYLDLDVDDEYRIIFYENTGEGFERREQEFYYGYYAYSIEIVDLNGDNNSDIFIAGRSDVFEGEGEIEPPLKSKNVERMWRNGVSNGKRGPLGDFTAKLINTTNVLNSAPSAPSNVSYVQQDNYQEFIWDASIDDFTSLPFYNAELLSGDGDTIATSNSNASGYHQIVSIGNAGKASQYFNSDSLSDGLYTLKVQAIDDANVASGFSTLNFEVDRTPPDAPSNLMVSSDVHVINLSWTQADSADVTNYNIYRFSYPLELEFFGEGPQERKDFELGFELEAAELIASVDGDQNTYSDSIYNTIEFIYWVAAVDEQNNESLDSTGVEATAGSLFSRNDNEEVSGYFNILGETDWADYDGDGDLDLAIAGTDFNGSEYGEIAIFKNDGSGNMSKDQILNNGSGYATIDWADLDGDGDMDLVATGERGTQIFGKNADSLYFDIYVNNGSGQFTVTDVGFEGSSIGEIVTTDWNDDGLIDIIVGGGSFEGGGSGLFTLINKGNLVFEVGDSLPDLNFLPYDLKVADLNNDGKEDLITTGEGGEINTGIMIITNEDSGLHIISIPGLDGQLGLNFDIGDFDDDGDLDISFGALDFEGGPEEGTIIRILRNDGNFNFTSQDVLAVNSIYVNASWIDFDNDGDLDIVSSSFFPEELTKAEEEEEIPPEFRTFLLENKNGEFDLVDYELHIGATFGYTDIVDLDQDGDSDFFLTGIHEFFFKNAKNNSIQGILESLKNRTINKTEDKMEGPPVFFSSFINNTTNPNISPATPVGLSATASNNSIEFSWDASSDDLTSNGVFYNMKMTNSLDGQVVINSQSENDGFHKTVSKGNVGQPTTWSLLDSLPDGNYTWSVQAIDHNGAASSFSESASLRIDNTPPDAVANFAAFPLSQSVQLNWDENLDEDFAFYVIVDANTGAPYDTIPEQSVDEYLVEGLTNGVQYDFSIFAVDIGGLQSNGALASATPINYAPEIIEPIEDLTFDEDFGSDTLMLDYIFSDAEGDELSYLVESDNEVLMEVSTDNNYLILNSNPDENGMMTIIISASDQFASVADTFVVTVNSVNDAPYVDNSLPNQALDEDFLPSVDFDLYDVFEDVDHDDTEFSFTNTNPSLVAISIEGGTLTMSSITNLEGIDTLIVTATDPGGLSVNDTMFIAINMVNDNPVVSVAQSDITVDEDFESFNIDGNTMFEDVETSDENLEIEVDLSQGLVDINIEDNIITISPIENVNGTDTMIISAMDEGFKYARDTVIITIDPVDDAPNIVNAIEDIEVNEDFESFVVDVSTVFADGDGDFEVSLETDDSGILEGVYSEGEITFESIENANGSQQFVLTAASIAKNDLSVTDTFTVVVNPINDAPLLETISYDNTLEDIDVTLSRLTFKIAFMDEIEGDTMTSVIIKTLPQNGSLFQGESEIEAESEINFENGDIVYHPNQDFYGFDSFTWNASDGQDFAESDGSVEFTLGAVTNPVEFVSATAGDGTITLVWNPTDESDVSMYDIYRSTENLAVESEKITTVTDDTTLTIIGLTNYTEYFFWIKSVDDGGNESNFNQTISATPIDLTAPGVPTNVQALAGDARAILSWSFVNVAELANFKVFGGTNQNNLSLMGTQTTPATRSLTITGLTNGAQYFFRVNATDTAGNEGEQSALVSVTPQALAINVALLQNQLVNSNATVQVLTNLALTSTPVVQSTSSSNQVTNIPVTTSNNTHYSGLINFTENGNYTISVDAESSNGREASFERVYTVSSISAKVVNEILDFTTDAKFEIPKNGILGEGKAILSHDDQDDIYQLMLNRELKKDMRVELPYDVDVFADASKLFIYQEVDGKWEALPTQVFTKKTSVVAYTRESGRFLVAFDELFDGSNIVPEDFALSQNYPNPFNPTTSIKYDLAKDVNVSIVIFNTLGQKVRTLVREFQRAGSAKVATWNARNDRGERVASGIYFYQLQAGNKIITKKMVLIK